jgi:mannitol-1-phosphate/altronate dehydrogenase
MISITRGQANTFDVTLTEKTLLSAPVYLFRFTNEATNTQNTCIATDSSSFTRRYNRFTITESTSENRTNATLTLAYGGFWRYEIYEQTSTTDLVVGPQNKVEDGDCQVTDSSVLDTYISQTNADTYVE